MKLIATRKIDELGRILLPMEIRKRYQLEADTALDICVDDSGQIVLQRQMPFCKICGETERLVEIAKKNVYICDNCKSAINEMDS